VLENLIIPGPGDGFRGDLASINMQRGRDHGLPGYIEFSKACGGPAATGSNFNDLTDIPRTQRDKLSRAYRTVEDIDVFAGILSENILEGSAMGRTATCLFLAQFNNTRRGDRFWYENDDDLTGFPIKQLDEIRKCNLARVICDNSDGVFTIQPKVFMRRFNNSPNDDVPCSDLPYVDLNVFKESKYCLLFAICILDILLRWKKNSFFFLQYFENVSTNYSGSKHSIKLVLKVTVAKFAPSYET